MLQHKKTKTEVEQYLGIIRLIVSQYLHLYLELWSNGPLVIDASKKNWPWKKITKMQSLSHYYVQLKNYYWKPQFISFLSIDICNIGKSSTRWKTFHIHNLNSGRRSYLITAVPQIWQRDSNCRSVWQAMEIA